MHTNQTETASTEFHPAPNLSAQDSDQSTNANEFSVRTENTNDGIPVDDVDQSNIMINAVETQEEMYDRLIDLLRRTSAALRNQNAKSELAARNHLIQVAKLVHAPDFDVHRFGKRAGKKPSKAHLRNPYIFVISCVDESRDRQLASNQAIALQYALKKAQREGRDIDHCFDGLSLRECIRLSRLENTAAKSEYKSSKEKPIQIHGIPMELLGRGRVAIEIDFAQDFGRFVKVADVF